MKLFIWVISDTVVEHGLAIALAPTKAAAIDAVCNTFAAFEEEEADQLRAELKATEPRTETDQTFGYFSASPT